MRTCSRCGKLAASHSPRTNFTSSGQSAGIIARLAQAVRIARGQVESVYRLQRLDLLPCDRREGRLVLEGMQHDAFQQIPEREVELGRERFQHLEQAAFQAHAGLGSGDRLHGYNVTKVPSYHTSASC